MLEPLALAGCFAVIYAAGLVQGILGSGFALVAAPILVLFFDPKTAVPIILVLATFINLLLYREVRGRTSLRRMLPLMIAGVAGIPVGTYLLTALDPNAARIGIGCLVAGFALAFLAGFERPIGRENLGLAVTGIASGILNGVASTSGPPVILFLANQGMAKDAFRATLIAYFLFLNLATLPFYLASGLISRAVLAYAGVLFPAMVLGGLTGSRLSQRLPERAFRRLCLLAVVAAGVLSVLSGAGLL